MSELRGVTGLQGDLAGEKEVLVRGWDALT